MRQIPKWVWDSESNDHNHPHLKYVEMTPEEMLAFSEAVNARIYEIEVEREAQEFALNLSLDMANMVLEEDDSTEAHEARMTEIEDRKLWVNAPPQERNPFRYTGAGRSGTIEELGGLDPDQS